MSCHPEYLRIVSAVVDSHHSSIDPNGAFRNIDPTLGAFRQQVVFLRKSYQYEGSTALFQGLPSLEYVIPQEDSG